MKEKLNNSELDEVSGGTVISPSAGYANINVGTRYSVTWSDARGSGKFEGTVVSKDTWSGVRFSDMTYISGDKPDASWSFVPSRMTLTAI